MSQAPNLRRGLFRRAPKAPEIHLLPERKRNEVALVIQGAIKLIEDYGWVQNRMGHYDIGFCMLGALRRANKDLGFRMHVYEEVKDVVRAALPSWWGYTTSGDSRSSIARYNDRIARSSYEVFDTLRRAEQLAISKQAWQRT